MTQQQFFLDPALIQFIFFGLGLVCVFVNVFAKSPALSIATIFLMVASLIAGATTTVYAIMPYACIIIIIGSAIGAWNYGTRWAK